jgi:hypothetical protein
MASHSHHHSCHGCCISRRCFLSTVSSAAVGLSVLGTRAAYGANELGETIDLNSFRPRPKLKIASAVLREPPPYWLGWPGTSYDLEGERSRYNKAFDDCAARVGAEIAHREEPVENAEGLETLVNHLKSFQPDGVILSLQHLSSWKAADEVVKAGFPTIIFAPVGTAFTQHVKEISRRPKVHVVSSLDVSGVEQGLRSIRALKQFNQTRLMVLRGTERKQEDLELLGTTVKTVPRDALHEVFNKMPENEEVHHVAEEMWKGADNVVEPSEQDGLNAARSFTAAKRLLLEEECNAITSDCLGMVTNRLVPTPPCMAACIFQDAGVTYGCEADVDGALSLMLPSYLLDKPGFMNDPVPETVKNHLIVAHCVSGTKLNGFEKEHEPYILRSHSESALGVSLQVIWEPGHPVTLVRFKGPKEVIVDTGTVVENVQTPPAGGCRTNFEVAMDEIEDVRDVLGFHQVVFYGDHRRDVQAFAQMAGIKVIHSPRYVPEVEQPQQG